MEQRNVEYATLNMNLIEQSELSEGVLSDRASGLGQLKRGTAAMKKGYRIPKGGGRGGAT